MKILTGLVFAFLPFAVLAQDGSTGPEERHEDHLVAMQASNPFQSIQPTHEEADAALNGHHIVGAAAEPAREIQSVNFSSSTGDELKVDDAIEQVSIPPQNSQSTHEEGAALGGVAELTGENNNAIASASVECPEEGYWPASPQPSTQMPRTSPRTVHIRGGSKAHASVQNFSDD